MALYSASRVTTSFFTLGLMLLFLFACSTSDTKTVDSVADSAASDSTVQDTADLAIKDQQPNDLIDGATGDLPQDLGDSGTEELATHDLADAQSPEDTTPVPDSGLDTAIDQQSDVFVCTSKQQCSGPHDACVGYWQCDQGKCNWICDATCKPAGESIAVIPNAPKCCDNLIKISCDKPDQNGSCQLACAGASICANCGDGICGAGENKCNCPQDCNKCSERSGECKSNCDQGQSNVTYFCDSQVACCYGISDCAAKGGSCKASCGGNETQDATPCSSTKVCCTPKESCTGLGQGYIGSGTCCPGLTPVADCDLGVNGCVCKKCLCSVCLPVKDGVCGPYEHQCNSPEDCPNKDKCLPTNQSSCEGTPNGEDPKGELALTPKKSGLSIELTKFTMNCCRLAEFCVQVRASEIVVSVKTRPSYTPCKCICLFTLSTTIEGIKPGNYKLTLYDELASEPTKPLHTIDSIEIK